MTKVFTSLFSFLVTLFRTADKYAQAIETTADVAIMNTTKWKADVYADIHEEFEDFDIDELNAFTEKLYKSNDKPKRKSNQSN